MISNLLFIICFWISQLGGCGFAPCFPAPVVNALLRRVFMQFLVVICDPFQSPTLISDPSQGQLLVAKISPFTLHQALTYGFQSNGHALRVIGTVFRACKGLMSRLFFINFTIISLCAEAQAVLLDINLIHTETNLASKRSLFLVVFFLKC